MSQIDGQIPFNVLDLKPALEKFLPKEIFESLIWLDSETPEIGIANLPAVYGAQDILFKNVQNFVTFPGSATVFNQKLTAPYTGNPMIYVGLKGKEYIYKHDFLISVQRSFLKPPLAAWENNLLYRTIAYYLKTEESKSNGRFDMVEDPESGCERISKYSSDVIKKRIASFVPSSSTLTLNQHFENWKSIMPAHKDDPEYQAIFEMLKESITNLDSLKVSQTCERVVMFCGSIVELFKRFINEKPDLCMSTHGSSSRVIIRLFKNDKINFIFVRDLMNSMKRGGMDVTALEEQYEKADELATIDLKEAFSLLGKSMSEIEFVTVPITRTKYRVSYIPTWDGKYCVPVSDVFNEILEDLVRGKKILQFTNADNFHEVFSIFNSLEALFGCKLNKITYIDIERAESIKKRVQLHFDNYIAALPEDQRKAKSIRFIEGHCNAERLKKELEYLGITKNFSQCLEQADHVYEELSETRKLCDMAVVEMAIEIIQYSIIYRSLPILGMFQHFQKACHRWIIACRCVTETIPADEEYSENAVSEAHKIEDTKQTFLKSSQISLSIPMMHTRRRHAKIADLKKRSYKVKVLNRTKYSEVHAHFAKNCVCDILDDCLHCILLKKVKGVETAGTSESENSVEMDKQMKRREKRRRQTIRKKMEKEEQQSQPESNACEKCIRTSGYCIKANKLLREEKITTKALRKDVAEKDLKILQLEELVSRLQHKLARSTPAISEHLSTSTVQVNTPLPSEESGTNSDDSPASVEEKEYTPRELAPTYKYSELTPEMRDKIHEFIAIRDTLPTSFYEICDAARKVIRKTKNLTFQAVAREERRIFSDVYERYLEAVQRNIDWIRNNKDKTAKDIPPLPTPPVMSERFRTIYLEVVNEIDDPECLICHRDMEATCETFKCDECRRRLHTECASKWFEVKKECPVCERHVQ